MKSSPSLLPLPTLLVVLFLCHTSGAQELDSTHDEQKAAMAKLKPLAGEWKGSGWIQFGPRRFEFQGTEVFAEKAGALAIVVTGLHHMPMPDGTKRVVHNAVGMINFDAKTDRYRFATQLANGRAGTYFATLTADGDFQWTIPKTPLGQMVYTISFQKEGEYHEIGELVSKTKSRQKFFEMNLRRVTRPKE